MLQGHSKRIAVYVKGIKPDTAKKPVNNETELLIFCNYLTKPFFFGGLTYILSSDHPTIMTEGHGDECIVHEPPS